MIKLKMTKNIVSDKPAENYTKEMYGYMVQKAGISENIRFAGDKGFFSSNLGHLCDSAGEVLHGAVKEGVIAAKRHIHFDPKSAEEFGVTNGQIVSLKVQYLLLFLIKYHLF